MEITHELVRELFDYKDGFLYWKVKFTKKIRVGVIAGTIHKIKNRRIIRIDRKIYYSSRLIFLWHKGYLPVIVDHKDRNTLNEEISNLRDSDHNTNCKNKTSAKNSTSKYLGVSWSKYHNKWKVQIKNKGKVYAIGYFESDIEGAKAYNIHAKIHHGEFANLNII